MAAVESFATDAISEGDRLRFWNELADRFFFGTRVSAPRPDFNGTLKRWEVSNLLMTRLASSASSVERAPPYSSESNLVLHFQMRGRTRHRQANLEAGLSPGDYVLSSCESPYTIHSGGHELLVAEFPRQPLLDRIKKVDDLTGRRGLGSTPAAHLLRHYLLSLWTMSDLSFENADWESGASEAFFDLLALALNGHTLADGLNSTDVRRDRLLRLVEARLGDEDLSSAAMAAELGISIRTLQMMFAKMGTTPSAYVLERRLRRCADSLLSDPGRMVTDIAFDHGFNDSGHFSRCFRQYFGMPPSAWRKRALS